MKAEKKVEQEEEEAVKGGELLFCGATRRSAIGGRNVGNFVSLTRLRPLVGVNIRLVVSGCASFHCVALDKGQLGHGDTMQRDMPAVVSKLSQHTVVGAAAGRSHTVLVTKDGLSFSFGWNKHGQLGTEVESSPVHCLVSEVRTAACGADFSVWLTSVEGASILTAGLPQYGQLGHGTDNEYNTKSSSVRLAYEAQPCPKTLASLAGETIVKVACGTNHTVAVDSNGFVYTWGFGGYGRLGHREQKDEWIPRRVDIFTKHNVLPPDAIISAGSLNSACTAGGGQLYMWGKIKNAGDDWMYPKPLMDLSGWNIRCMDSGNTHHFVGAETSCISWGQSLSGELGYGPDEQKSSTNPKKVEILEGMHVISVACGFAHSLVVADRMNVGDLLDQFDVYDDKTSGKENSEKRKSKDSSELEEDKEKDSDDESDESDDGQAEQKMQRGGKTGRGRDNGALKLTPEKKSADGCCIDIVLV
ncbi:hypothetical protein HYC85_020677 [Camellia sinensis]|uniref:RCC1-like domain-containing protein n=1 Tax=Camellia sinensis TaxID=4442 RepID=A0A7J7GS75_CAMSI|nr:hypothetical protein HYC85_020677 [Camellia sinensis]